MRITVFGATGGTGQSVVSQALDRSYEVVAYVRNPQKLEVENPHLTVIQGELTDRETVASAIKGSDCVLSALGAIGKPEDDAELSEGIATIISVMEESGVRRFIVLSTTSAEDPLDQDGLRFKLRRDIIRKGRPSSYEEIRRFTQMVRDSDTAWTLLRIASMLNNKPLTKHVHAGYLGDKELTGKLSRIDLAWFMLEQIDADEFMRKAPAVSN